MSTDTMFNNMVHSELPGPPPDLYLSGQGEYLDALRLQVVAALNGDVSASDALNDCARLVFDNTKTWQNTTNAAVAATSQNLPY